MSLLRGIWGLGDVEPGNRYRMVTYLMRGPTHIGGSTAVERTPEIACKCAGRRRKRSHWPMIVPTDASFTPIQARAAQKNDYRLSGHGGTPGRGGEDCCTAHKNPLLVD